MEETSVKYYSKTEFNTEEPYRVLFGFKNNRFQYNQIFTILKDNAAAVGFQDFNRMLKSYEKEQCDKGDIIDNITQFEGQKLELKTGEWVADDFGVTCYNERNGEEIACVHPIMPIECLTNIDTGTEKLRIAFRKGRQWRNEIYERRTIASAHNILELANYGVAVTSENARYLVQYLHDVENLNYGIIPQHNSVTRLGWTNSGGFSPYIDDLIFDGQDVYPVTKKVRKKKRKGYIRNFIMLLVRAQLNNKRCLQR